MDDEIAAVLADLALAVNVEQWLLRTVAVELLTQAALRESSPDAALRELANRLHGHIDAVSMPQSHQIQLERAKELARKVLDGMLERVQGEIADREPKE